MAHSNFFITGKLIFSPKKIFVESQDTTYYVRLKSLPRDSVHGDIVRARITKKGETSRLAEVDIVSRIRRSEEILLGRFTHDQGKIFLEILPEQGHFRKDFLAIPTGYLESDIVFWKFNMQGRVSILQKFASENDFDIEEQVLFYLGGIDISFPEALLEAGTKLQEAQKSSPIIQQDQRTDLRDWYTCTIDGKDAKDLDDALSLKKLQNNHILLAVHIADVAEYVREGSPLDREALKRATSLYTPGQVIPMLPESLSNDLCSLHPGTPKAAISCIMEIDSAGHVRHTKIVESIIESHHRGVYEDIQALYDAYKSGNVTENSALLDSLNLAYDLYERLKNRRKKEGKILFESTEVYFDFPDKNQGEKKIPQNVRKRSRLDAHMLIEECMILANEEVAKWCDREGLPFLSRIHGLPSSTALEVIREILLPGRSQSLKKDASKKMITPGEIRRFLDGITDPQELYRLSRLLLPKMAKAHYADKKSLHFGLALEYYAHFTSPIRRYPDLQVHRIIKEKLRGDLTPERVKHYQSILKRVARHCSEREKGAEDLERIFDSLYACRYMQDKVGTSYTGVIAGLSEFAIFVELESGIEGTLYLPRRRFQVNQMQGTLEADGKILYTIGQKIPVQIEHIDMQERRVILQKQEQ